MSEKRNANHAKRRGRFFCVFLCEFLQGRNRASLIGRRRMSVNNIILRLLFQQTLAETH
jgi:hypothetical protein